MARFREPYNKLARLKCLEEEFRMGAENSFMGFEGRAITTIYGNIRVIAPH
jgi:hypothetical protein